MSRYLMLALLAYAFDGCGSSTHRPADSPSLTFNDTTIVNSGDETVVDIPSNTYFTIKAPGVVDWDYNWNPESNDARAYSSGLAGDDTYTVKIAVAEAIQYVVKANFADGHSATFRINVVSGGTCEGVTCLDHGKCSINTAGFPICDCIDPYYADGFLCRFIGSCAAEDDSACIDYIGPLWNNAYNCSFGDRLSNSPCTTPAESTLVGSCRATGQIGSTEDKAEYIINYYSTGFDSGSAQTNCGQLPLSAWMPATP